jgi:hypothetical protein
VDVDQQKTGEDLMSTKRSSAAGTNKRTDLGAIALTDTYATLTKDETEAVKGSKKEEPTRKRPGIKQHTAYLPEAVHEQLRRLAFEENRKIHDYLLEGLDRVFANRGLKSIKELT